MNTNPNPASELADQETWRGLRPGMTRQEVMAVINAAGVSTEDMDDEPWQMLEEWGMEFQFEADGQQRLRQISRDEDELTWKGNAILCVPIHTALRALGTLAREAVWHPDDAVNEPFDGSGTAREGPVTDEMLLSDGSVWFPSRGLALVMSDGLVNEIVWRRAEDLPVKFAGPVTEAQLTLSARPDLEDHLRAQYRAAVAQGNKWSPLQWIIAAFTAVMLISIVTHGWQEMQAWQQALTVTGNLASIETKPGKLQEKIYHVEFKDNRGRAHTSALHARDFYVAPRETGEEVQVTYLEDHPEEARGPASSRDAAFLHYVPWVIVVVFFHIVAMITAGFFAKQKSAAATQVRPMVAGVKVIE